MNAQSMFCFLAMALGMSTGCTHSSDNGDGTIKVEDRDGYQLTICDVGSVRDTVSLPLSDLVEDCKLIRFEDADTALFRFSGLAVTDQHIAVRNSGGAVKLFDHNGKFLCDVGAYGQGPGEYQLLYDILIDEDGQSIYLGPFTGSKKIMKYDMNGNFQTDFDMGEELHKAKLALGPDGSVSMVHLCFKDMNTFMAANIAPDGTITKFLPPQALITETRDKNGSFMAFNNEIWAYRNVPGLSFMSMPVDTLYHYNAQKNKIEPHFALNINGSGEKPFSIYMELPNHYLGMIWDKGTILVDKNKKTSKYVKMTNDYFGNMEMPLYWITDGWFCAMYEPGVLTDAIEQTLSKGNISDKDRESLKSLLASIDENSNNLLFMGKLKK